MLTSAAVSLLLQVHYGGSWQDVPLVLDAFVINFGGE